MGRRYPGVSAVELIGALVTIGLGLSAWTLKEIYRFNGTVSSHDAQLTSHEHRITRLEDKAA